MIIKIRLITLIYVCFILCACGQAPKTGNATFGDTASGPCAGQQAVGIWKSNTRAEILTLDTQCKAQTTYCNESMSVSFPAANNITLIVSATNAGPECLSLGTHFCTTNFIKAADAETLEVTCSGVTRAYNRQ